MASKLSKAQARKKRHIRVRKKVSGTAEKPRLAVFRSNDHVYAQLIDDIGSVTLASASTVEAELRKEFPAGGNIESAQKVGELVAVRAGEKGIKTVVFDRGGFQFHGQIKALADGARDKGLTF